MSSNSAKSPVRITRILEKQGFSQNLCNPYWDLLGDLLDGTLGQNPRGMLWVKRIERSPQIACAHAELDMIAPSDCAQLLPGSGIVGYRLPSRLRRKQIDDGGIQRLC
jgi:hypothetical protein